MRCHSEDLIHASVENHGPVKPTLGDKSNRRGKERKGDRQVSGYNGYCRAGGGGKTLKLRYVVASNVGITEFRIVKF